MIVFRRSLFAILVLIAVASLCDIGEAADNSHSIPVGTVITLNNWQQYQHFMPEGMRLLFSGTIFWKLPADFQMVIGPTSSYPPPKAYLENTRKYSSRVKIKELPDGRHTITDYVAGLPFPDPAGPMKGYKILVDNWYRYIPYLVCGNDNHQVLQDRYGNTTAFKMALVDRRLSHISDGGQPINDRRAQGVDYSEWEMVLEPEQQKYTTTLTLYYVDPARPEDDFLFVPTLRRVIRESANSRCAPAFGSDWTPDDFKGGFNGGIAIFDADYLRDQPVLTLVNADPRTFGTLSNYYSILFPKPAIGKWEVHDTYVINARRIPSMRAGYCYGKQIMYIDKQNFIIVWKDVYDSHLKFAKMEMDEHIATSVPNEGIQWETNNTIETVWDPERKHMSWWATTGPGGRGIFANEKCRNVDGENYDDVQRYSTVGGLTQVMR
jgi:hypothetical protein